MFFKETTTFIIFNSLTFYTKKLFEHYQFQIGGIFLYIRIIHIDIIKIILQNRPSFMCIKSAPCLHLKSANWALNIVLFDALVLMLLTNLMQICSK